MNVPFPHRRLPRVALLAVVTVALAALGWWKGRELDVVLDAFRAVRWDWVVGAVALNLLSVLVRSIAWRTVIDQAMPPPHPRYRHVFSAFSVGLFANAVLPGRVGELARVAVLRRHLPRRRGLWATLAGTVFAHRVFDMVAVCGLVLYAGVAAEIPRWAETGLAVVVGIGIGLLVFSIVGARRHHRSPVEHLAPVRRIVTMARNGLGVMRAPLPAFAAMTFQCLGWLFQLLAVYAAMRGFRIHEPMAAAALVLLLMNVATLFPLWPGNVGLLQAAVALPLVAYGVGYAHGFAFGIGLQAIEASVGVGFGLFFLAREGLSFAMLKGMPTATEAEAPVRAA